MHSIVQQQPNQLSQWQQQTVHVRETETEREGASNQKVLSRGKYT